jgi:hypothetical protein
MKEMITPEIVLQILIAGGPYAAVCVAMAVFMRLHNRFTMESARGVETASQRAESAERRMQAAEAALAQIQSQVADLEEQALLSSGALAKSWTNINRRTQAVRMLRAGDKPSQVAAELSMSRAEVELIRRVQSLTSHESSIYSIGG